MLAAEGTLPTGAAAGEVGLLGLADFEDEEGDTLQDEASGNLQPKEGST